MSRTDLGGRRRVLLAALACTGLVLLFSRATPSAQAASAPITQASQSCGNSASSIETGFTNGTKLLSETDVQMCVTGRLTVTFAGDPASGCAAHGLCGYAGTETWEPAGIGDLDVSTYEHRGRRVDEATIFLGGAGAPVHSAVQRSGANETTAACSDEAQSEAGFFSLPVRGSRVTVGLDDAQAPLLGTRCAGPLDADVAGALPSRAVALTRILHGHDTIDLTSHARFAAHGLAGNVRSTIVLTLGDARRSTSPDGSSPPSSPSPNVKRSRATVVSYRVTHVGGSAIATVRSSPLAAICGPFDACGLQGTIDVTPGATSKGSAGLIATAPLRRPERDLLTALGITRGGNPAGIRVLGGGNATGPGEVSADLTQQENCRDRVGLHELVLELDRRANRLDVSLSPNPTQADPLRTRCPGPTLGAHRFTTASLPLAVLRHPTFTVKLRGVSFSNGPYRVTTRSTLTVTLRRTKVRTQILPYATRTR